MPELRSGFETTIKFRQYHRCFSLAFVLWKILRYHVTEIDFFHEGALVMTNDLIPSRTESSLVLTEKSFKHALHVLCSRDPDLAYIMKNLGPPPMWAREPGFPTLMLFILEQQVSLSSARAAYNRLLAAVSPLTAERFLTLDDASLKTIGFSRQKIVYGRDLAEAIAVGRLNLDALELMDNRTARSKLMKIKGIGPWTADVYLLMALLRPDIWPKGDLALLVAVQKLKGLDSRPKPDEFENIGTFWQPYRAVAARLLWHYYLNQHIILKTEKAEIERTFYRPALKR